MKTGKGYEVSGLTAVFSILIDKGLGCIHVCKNTSNGVLLDLCISLHAHSIYILP